MLSNKLCGSIICNLYTCVKFHTLLEEQLEANPSYFGESKMLNLVDDEPFDLSFGMCILKMMTCEHLYSCCDMPCYKKISEGTKQTVMSKVYQACLAPLPERCISFKLLSQDCFIQKDRMRYPSASNSSLVGI